MNWEEDEADNTHSHVEHVKTSACDETRNNQQQKIKITNQRAFILAKDGVFF